MGNLKILFFRQYFSSFFLRYRRAPISRSWHFGVIPAFSKWFNPSSTFDIKGNGILLLLGHNMRQHRGLCAQPCERNIPHFLDVHNKPNSVRHTPTKKIRTTTVIRILEHIRSEIKFCGFVIGFSKHHLTLD